MSEVVVARPAYLAPLARLGASLESRLPPARVTWIGLLAIAFNGLAVLGGVGALSVVVLPLVAVVVDLGLQWVRFERLRFPDAAIATGLFITVLLPPTVILAEAAVVCGAAIALRHAIRFRGRPVWNPAILGVVLGTLLFGMSPAWWVSLGAYGEPLLVAVGLLVLVRSRIGWRLPATFFAIYPLFSVLEHVLFGAALSSRVLLLTFVDPSALFFGLLMVPEPRTAPARTAAQPLYSAFVALGSVFLSLVLPAIGFFLSLLGSNLISVAMRRGRAPSGATTVSRPARRRQPATERWSITRRVGVGVFALMLVGFAAAAAGPPAHPQVLLASHPLTNGGGSGGGSGCASDNASIPASTLSMLHQALGPSVILSYAPNTAVTVFYDPVNQVTVTETDLYEDYGYAEFNGDDYAVSGCSA